MFILLVQRLDFRNAVGAARSVNPVGAKIVHDVDSLGRADSVSIFVNLVELLRSEKVKW
jgi:hypothetical protein